MRKPRTKPEPTPTTNNLIPNVDPPAMSYKAAAYWVPVDMVRPWDRNPRDNDGSVESVADSMRKFGFGRPIVARYKDREIIAGHTSLKAAISIGLAEVAVRFVDLDEADAHLLAIADNRLGESAKWIPPLLVETLKAYEPADVQIAGYSAEELDALVVSVPGYVRSSTNRTDDEGGEKVEDLIPDQNIDPASRVGDMWILGEHRILCGDSFTNDLDRLLAGELVDLVVTDPPYAIYGSSTGIGSDIADDKMVRPFFEAVFRILHKRMRHFAHAYLCCDWRSWASIWESGKRTGMTAKNCIVWDKNDSGLGSSYANTHELIAFYAKLPEQTAMKSTEKRGQRMVHKSNMVRFNRVQGDERHHNAAKPVGMFVGFVENSSDAGEIVLDIFGGSGTTLIACERVGRRARVMELEPRYVDVTIKRWQKETGKLAVLDTDGRTFDEINANRRAR